MQLRVGLRSSTLQVKSVVNVEPSWCSTDWGTPRPNAHSNEVRRFFIAADAAEPRRVGPVVEPACCEVVPGAESIVSGVARYALVAAQVGENLVGREQAAAE